MTRFRSLSTRRKIAVVLLGAAVLIVALLAAGMAFLNFGHGSDQNAVQAQNPGQGFAPWPSTEYEIKAAMLLNFAGFVKWPAPKGQFTIGILGQDPFGSAFDQMLQGREVGGRKMVIIRSREAGDLTGCQIVFIPMSEQAKVAEILARLRGAHVLTVGEHEGFVKQGGAIGFSTAGGKVRFEINTGAARDAGLEINPRLLQLSQPAR